MTSNDMLFDPGWGLLGYSGLGSSLQLARVTTCPKGTMCTLEKPHIWAGDTQAS